MNDYPAAITAVNHVEPVPRRIRAFLADEKVLDTTGALYVYLIPSGTVTSCPYKGTTSRYWSVRAGDTVHPDLAWAYDFPTRQLQPIAGLVAFYNEKVDLFLGGQRLERPKTHFFASAGSPDTP